MLDARLCPPPAEGLISYSAPEGQLMQPPFYPSASFNDSTYDGVHERRRVPPSAAFSVNPLSVTDGPLVQQEAVRGAGPADRRRDRPGQLPADSRARRVAGLRLPGLEERLAGDSGIRGDGVRVRQAEELHLHEGLQPHGDPGASFSSCGCCLT